MRAALLVVGLAPAVAAALFLRARAIEARADAGRSAWVAPSEAGIEVIRGTGRAPPPPRAPPGTMVLRLRGPNGVTLDTIPVLGARPAADDPRAIPVPVGVPDTLPGIECPMAVQRVDTTRLAPMPIARPRSGDHHRMPIARPRCRNPLGN